MMPKQGTTATFTAFDPTATPSGYWEIRHKPKRGFWSAPAIVEATDKLDAGEKARARWPLARAWKVQELAYIPAKPGAL